MQIVIDMPDEKWVKVLDGTWCGSKEIADGIPLDKVIEDIKTEIRKPLDEERFFDTENAKAQAIALNWCLEIIDKHINGTCDTCNNPCVMYEKGMKGCGKENE